MIFVACLTSFMLRVNMSINLLAMVKPTTNNSYIKQTTTALASSNSSDSSGILSFEFSSTTFAASNESSAEEVKKQLQNFGPRYEWDQNTQGRILGAYFYGYLFTSLPAGLLAERYGPKFLLTLSFVASAIITALTPVFASFDAWYVIVSRALIGLLAGFVYPAIHNLIARWIPPNERGKVVACISGGSTFGTVITWPIAGILTEQFGWVYAFYIPALFVLAIAVIWWLLIEDSPDQHKTITVAEKQFLGSTFGNTVSKTKSWPPFGKVFTSLPYLALLILHYGNFWGMNFFITQAPKFMNEVLGFKLSNAGFLSSLPYLARMISGFFFGYIGDLIRQKDIMSTTAVRKSFCLFSHLIPGVLLFLLPFIAQDPLVCVACIVACLGFNGSSTITNLVNAQDLSPNFAATLYGFMNFLGTTAGFLAPMLVAYFTAEKNTMEEWRNVFLISAGIYVISGIIFIVFGSGKVQKWNEIVKKPQEQAKVATYNRDSAVEDGNFKSA
ncbi:sialin-like isoform X2 [Toxorhynchites rutilus septentrionalis]|nr:sialin-like isoform X2 [Toxorhynchites rutilus septentrionalis]XP_055624147.1 sialin-like isoform X2 [Toxorhynchites rutilus septentrionalis]XP_055624148.1 sialin-like isoform X2 [Toxorhynchites rutilus septentrionalis]XP_055624149.1 sialin-like isoform X2 [Toxorhynchites rutilus septentrionalis]